MTAADPILVNRTTIVAGAVHRARACDRCGSPAATLSYAVSLDEGGQRSDWNTNALCASCREDREIEAETLVSRVHSDAAAWRRVVAGIRAGRRGPVHDGFDPATRKRRLYEVKGRLFTRIDDAAEFFEVSSQTIRNWIDAGRDGSRRVR